MDADSDEGNQRDPYRDDPTWQSWHANACDVQGGKAGESSSDDDDTNSDIPLVLPNKCVCKHCRLIFNY